ncbi:MAG TPA: sigma-54 dependent transcriptional regulator [Vicinamibacteria bacterium]|nr:sigma-54 dependent transcriptional regulator [Vicinamibacteria bacterium]
MERILVVDDEAGVRTSLRGILEDEGYRVECVATAEAALARLSARRYDLVLLDIWLPNMDGMEALHKIREKDIDTAVIMISGHGTIENAVKAIQLGAYNFVEKPLSLDKTVIAVNNALRQRRLEAENRYLRERVESKQVLIGESASMRELRKQIAIAAPTNGRVLVFGENGTGKELVARSIHAQSLRKDGNFVEVNCAAIPEELIESELFGHVKGAFTGAVSNRKGKFESADSGTLFLDEVGDMSLKTQAKVLRVLQEQKFEAVGSTESVEVDCRVIAATNKDLEREIASGSFREDLFFRLNVIPFYMPPLRERREDIPSLVAHFIEEFSVEYGKRPKTTSPEAMEMLMSYQWPGNVRELKNVIERLVIMITGDVVGVGDLPNVLRRGRGDVFETVGDFRSLSSAREAFERGFILKTLQKNGGNVSRTAEALQIERSHLYRKMKAYGIR